MPELLATLGWFELGAAIATIITLIGAIVHRAYFKPLRDDIDELKEDGEVKEGRIRDLEKTQAEHGVEITTVKEATMKLVDRMDKLLDHIFKSNKEDK